MKAEAMSWHINVRDLGATGNGVVKDTGPVQAAIDTAEKEGGATVTFPAGRYLCGTIHLRSNVTIHLPAGATILASRDEEDFDPYERLPFTPVNDRETTYFHYALLAGEDVRQVAVIGEGGIDGNRPKRGGPKPIALKRCQHITIRGITITNAPNYSISLLGCDHVDIDGVQVLNAYSDGIDPDSCRFVRIANCLIDSHDDAICAKASLALGSRRSTEHLAVTNCILSTECNNIKLGTESSGDFKNIAVTNCAIYRRPSGARPATSGVAIESVDGSNIDGVVVSNITMQEVRAPIFIRLGNRGRGMNPPVPGSLRNVSISNVVASLSDLPTPIMGIPGSPVRGVSLSNLNITVKGGGTFRGLDLPENVDGYPDADVWGTYPACAFYCRHVEGLTLSNVRLRCLEVDARPAAILDDVVDVDIDGLKAPAGTGEHPRIWLSDTTGVLVRGCLSPVSKIEFVRVSGARSKRVRLSGNILADGRSQTQPR
jgi:polygalacturonase